MSIDWNAFSPTAAIAGGLLIGVASAMFALLNGRIAGISGIIGGLINARRGDIGWRAAFLTGLVTAPLAYAGFAALPALRIDSGFGTLIVAGLLVGFGTRAGSGCTSGHGVCGISRLSPRSFVATVSFMVAGFATTFVMRHLLGL